MLTDKILGLFEASKVEEYRYWHNLRKCDEFYSETDEKELRKCEARIKKLDMEMLKEAERVKVRDETKGNKHREERLKALSEMETQLSATISKKAELEAELEDKILKLKEHYAKLFEAQDKKIADRQSAVERARDALERATTETIRTPKMATLDVEMTAINRQAQRIKDKVKGSRVFKEVEHRLQAELYEDLSELQTSVMRKLLVAVERDLIRDVTASMLRLAVMSNIPRECATGEEVSDALWELVTETGNDGWFDSECQRDVRTILGL